MSLLGSLAAGLLGLKSDKKKNKRLKEEQARQQQYTNMQLDLAKYIREIGEQARNLKPAEDYMRPLTDEEMSLERASQQEDMSRFTIDQALRRRGMQEADQIRGRAATEAGTAANDMANFRSGIGRVDPRAIASTISLDNQAKLNAGYDDAERAAQTLQTRTGSSSISDALASLARDRVRARAGLPNADLEALGISEQVNQGRYSQLAGAYDTFSGKGSNFYDAQFVPTDAYDKVYGRATDAMKFDLSKLDLAMGGGGSAASTIGNAAAGNRAAAFGAEDRRIHAPTAKFVGAMDAKMDSLIKQIMGSFGG
jgi:hypothetical protein